MYNGRQSLFLILFACVSACAGEPMLSPKSRLAAAPFYSADRAICVRAAVAQEGYRAPVLGFVDRIRSELTQAFRLPIASADYQLDIWVGEKRDGDTRVLAGRIKTLDNIWVERIELVDPEAADLEQIRLCIGKALLRTYLLKNGGTIASLDLLPEWVIQGVMRSTDQRQRQRDMDTTLAYWTRAQLPFARELFSADQSPACSDRAVAAVLAGYLLEKRPKYNAFEVLLLDAAAGRTWQPQRVAQLTIETNDLHALDRFMDFWFIRQSRAVLAPGLTTSEIVRRFRSYLLIYPACSDTIGSYTKKTGMSFEGMVHACEHPDVRRAAATQMTNVRLAALGRDDQLCALAEAYARLLGIVAHSKKASVSDLERLFNEAEYQRRELEHAVANGQELYTQK